MIVAIDDESLGELISLIISDLYPDEPVMSPHGLLDLYSKEIEIMAQRLLTGEGVEGLIETELIAKYCEILANSMRNIADLKLLSTIDIVNGNGIAVFYF